MEMTWREFQLRRIGYLRMQKTEWEKVRWLSFHTMASVGALKQGATLEKFMPLDSKKTARVSKDRITMLSEMQKEFFK